MRVRPIEITIITLIVRALERVKLSSAFESDPYETRRKELPGPRLIKILVVYQLLKHTKLRRLVDAIAEHKGLQKELGGKVARNTLSNALGQCDPEQMIEAWMLALEFYKPWVARMGKKFAQIAVVDASLIKLSLSSYDWAEYRKKSGAGKLTGVLDWVKGIPQQLVITAGKVADIKAATALKWTKGWTYVFDRGYVGFEFLGRLVEAGAHFVVRFKEGINYQVLERCPVSVAPKSAGFRLTSDWLVRLPTSELVFRLVSYQLPDGTLIRVLTDRMDLTALSVAQLYKERWKIENWWKWLKRMYKIKEPLGRSQNAFETQVVGAFVTDLLLRAFKDSSGFKGSIYEFVSGCQELSLVLLRQMSENSRLRRALEAILKLLEVNKQPFPLAA